MVMKLGRTVEFDERNLRYHIRNLGAPQIPRNMLWACEYNLDQGMLSACVGFSWAQCLGTYPHPDIGIDNQTGINIYAQARIENGEINSSIEGTSVLSGVKAVQDLYPKTIDTYHWAFSIEDVITTIGYVGPIVLGVNWYNSMFEPDKSGLVSNKGVIVGGHAILANGVDVDNKLIRLHNSWGQNWGINGEAFITFDDLAQLLADNGEACVPVGKHTVSI